MPWTTLLKDMMKPKEEPQQQADATNPLSVLMPIPLEYKITSHPLHMLAQIIRTFYVWYAAAFSSSRISVFTNNSSTFSTHGRRPPVSVCPLGWRQYLQSVHGWVFHTPSTNRAQRCLTSVIVRELVLPGWYAAMPKITKKTLHTWVKTKLFSFYYFCNVIYLYMYALM